MSASLSWPMMANTGMFGARIVSPTAKLPTTVIFGAVIFGLAIDRSLLKETLGSQRAGEDRFLGDVGPGHLAGDHTIPHDEDARAVQHQLRQLRRNHQDADALLGDALEDRI